jgi:hypothetical protein
MGVRTEADEQLDKADENIKAAIERLSKIVVDKCWGYDEYNKTYQHTIQESLRSLLEVRENLNR